VPDALDDDFPASHGNRIDNAESLPIEPNAIEIPVAAEQDRTGRDHPSNLL